MFDTKIKNWFLVSLKNTEEIDTQVLWGIVIHDKKGRWRSDDYVCTSTVVEKLEDGVYRTLNSEYKCCGEGKEITLGAEALFELRSGFSPEEYLAMRNLRNQGFSTE